MDILAHGLWSGAIYSRKRVWRAVFFGVAPDLFSFGILFASNVLKDGFSSLMHRSGPPPIETIPVYVFGLYSATHSLVVWAFIFLVVALYLRKIPWEFSAWGLHILTDIPTHTTRFFPTPFLWPLQQPVFIDGISWGTPWFFLLTYLSIFLAFLGIYLQRRKKSRAPL
ncbi:MAG: hypothetical protein HY471_00225 [Candidatus Sungbacteria bacterium]|nr:hypothetical protein [Candidatus Sungbacteria bacterium]